MRFIITIIVILLVSSCTPKEKTSNNISKFMKLSQEKTQLVKDYARLMNDPFKNKENIKKLDYRMREINKELELLSQESDVLEFQQRQRVNLPNDNRSKNIEKNIDKSTYTDDNDDEISEDITNTVQTENIETNTDYYSTEEKTETFDAIYNNDSEHEDYIDEE